MNIKRNNNRKLGAISEVSQFIFSRVAKKLNPQRVNGSVSEHSKKMLNSFSLWATSQGISNELKQYQEPIPLNYQETYPDTTGLKITEERNSLFDEALKNVIIEMKNEVPNKDVTHF